MTGNEHQYFEQLKQEIIKVFRQSYPGVNPSISEWKGQEIVDFQEDLLQKANGQISEKWFYTHMKSGANALPRIDVLNLLSRYAGYANWDDFVFRHRGILPENGYKNKANRVFLVIPALVLIILAILFGLYKLAFTREYTFCFIDADTREPVTNSIIDITLIKEGESPVSYLCSEDGCFVLKTGKSHIRFVVQSPYYVTDTIDRVLDKFLLMEKVKLRPNNYALMLSYFSRQGVKDWQQRRDQLDRMLDDAAVIYQVFGSGSVGMEIYTKWEFIDKITMPSSTLKQIEVLDSKTVNEKISLLRFRIKASEP